MTLEEVRAIFEHGFGVRNAKEWRKLQRADAKHQGQAAQHGGSDWLLTTKGNYSQRELGINVIC
jgi:hypothetical protein